MLLTPFLDQTHPPLPAFFPHLRAYWQSVPVTRVSLNPVSKHRCNVNPGSRRRSWAHKGMCELGIAPCMWERPLTESVQQSRVTAGWGAGKQPDPDRGEDTPSPQGSTTRRDRYVTQRLWKTESDEGSFGWRLKERKRLVLLPWCPVYPESLYGDVRVLQVHTVCEERLDIVKVLWFEFGDWGESVVILLDQLGHKVLIKGQLVVPGDHHLKLVREPT